MIRNISRRLDRLETRAKDEAAEAAREPHTMCFVNAVDKRVSCTVTWVNGKEVWEHFDPPREYEEFNMV